VTRVSRLFVLREARAPRGLSVDMELLIRLLEWSREEASGDVALHRLAEAIESLAGEGRTLTMDDYDDLMSGLSAGPAEGEPEVY